MSPDKQMRIEHDLLGEVAVPVDALYGAQTRRAVANFPVTGQRTIGDFPSLVKAMIYVKQAAARTNASIGQLGPSVADAILEAGQQVLEGERYDQFPVHHLHGGGGTSANMNVNEVLANIAEELLGGKRGQYRLVHPNDHLNLNQSTNDVYPTACHIALILQWPALKRALDSLTDRLEAKGVELRSQKRIARTCLQDAVVTSFKDLLGGYAAFVRRCAGRIDRAVDALHSVALGGTIVGRAEDAPNAYRELVILALRQVTEDGDYRGADHPFDAAQNLDDLVCVSSQLDLFARGLVKICKDLRLMNSGPEAGLGEVILPAVQPGSSIMPGKINPVIPEYAIQLCFKAMGSHAAAQAAIDHGELDLNVWESVVVFAALESMELLQSAVDALGSKCIAGLRADAQRNDQHVQTIFPRLTEVMKRHGYSRVTEVCKRAGGNWGRLRELLDQAFPDED